MLGLNWCCIRRDLIGGCQLHVLLEALCATPQPAWKAQWHCLKMLLPRLPFTLHFSVAMLTSGGAPGAAQALVTLPAKNVLNS